MTGVLIKREGVLMVCCLMGNFPLHQEAIFELPNPQEGDDINFYLHHEKIKKFAKLSKELN